MMLSFVVRLLFACCLFVVYCYRKSNCCLLFVVWVSHNTILFVYCSLVVHLLFAVIGSRIVVCCSLFGIRYPITGLSPSLSGLSSHWLDCPHHCLECAIIVWTVSSWPGLSHHWMGCLIIVRVVSSLSGLSHHCQDCLIIVRIVSVLTDWLIV
jgi:hypothetical protein